MSEFRTKMAVAILPSSSDLEYANELSDVIAHARIVQDWPWREIKSNVVQEGGDHKNIEKNTKIKPSWKNHTIFEENPSISMVQ